jgi:predicted exporter
VPLNAPALHDLGLFASLQLVGTILFVLIFLPHLIKTRGEASAVEPKLITRIARLKLPDNRWVVIGVVILTIVLGYFSLQTEFDTDMRNINYMTDRQRADMAFFGEMTREASDAEQLYIVGDGAVWEDALAQSAAIAPLIDSLERHSIVMRRNAVRQFLPTAAQQQQRLERWRRFVASFDDYAAEFAAASAREGFSPNAFSDFQDLLHEQYNVRSFESFRPFLATLFPTNMAGDSASTRKRIIEVLTVPTDYVDSVRSLIATTPSFNGIVFDVSSMNGSIANTLSDDFNYIGFACGAVVFLFLWLSLGRIELALISFLPMAVSWIWILGLMGLMGIKFNIVNVILATFIFGQGDDYTIFMTEGLSYEYAYRRKLLDSYKNSIIVSSLIMFIGIGTLMLAKHPALRSLGEVTVVGMISVVLTACLFPPMLFGWLIRLKDYRRRSLDAGFSELVAQVGRLYRYKGADVERTARRRLKMLAEAETELTALPAEEAILVDEVDGQGEAALLLVMLYPKRTIYICQYSADAEALLDGCLDEIGASLHRVTSEALAELHVSTHAPLLHIQRKTIKIR